MVGLHPLPPPHTHTTLKSIVGQMETEANKLLFLGEIGQKLGDLDMGNGLVYGNKWTGGIHSKVGEMDLI